MTKRLTKGDSRQSTELKASKWQRRIVVAANLNRICQLLPLVRQMSTQINVHITYALSEALSLSPSLSLLLTPYRVLSLGIYRLGLAIKIAALCLMGSCILKFYGVLPQNPYGMCNEVSTL